MASQITQYKLFIASPGGLEAERETFRKVVSTYNEADGFARGAQFTPVGWEITLRGVGRPQAKINEEVRECDYFVLLLWDRWGSPPDNEGRYSSGTEEEYRTAWECLRDKKRPMREIIVLFKAVDRRQLSDPGPQLQKVLEFKKTLEKEKTLFFDTFDDTQSLADKLARYLAQWTRDHERGNAAKKVPSGGKRKGYRLPAAVIDSFDQRLGEEAEDTGFIGDARKLLKQGKLTDAEAKFVQAIMPGDDMRAFRAYGQFLIKAHRLTDAESVYKEMLRIARDAEEATWAGTALAGLGGVYRIKNDYVRAHAALKEALALKEQAGDEEGAAYVAIWLGDLSLQRGRWHKAAESFEIALRYFQDVKADHARADTLTKLAKAALKAGDIDRAASAETEARKLYERLKDREALHSLKMWRRSALNKAVSGSRLSKPDSGPAS